MTTASSPTSEKLKGKNDGVEAMPDKLTT
jgi:hypothetical protein